jgi:2-iminoacetate synthase ThiH
VLDAIADKLRHDKRLERDEGRYLLVEAPLLELGALAAEARYARLPDKVVTFVVDTNPNYTNVCITDCQFCAFYRKPGDPEAWTLSVDEVLAKIASAVSRGATTVLLQGGHNPALPLEYYLALVTETRRRFPEVTPHFFTASEIRTMAEVASLSVPEVLDRLWEAGQRTLPGGGAEVLSERVRQRIEPKKGGPAAWLDVHREAHRRGFKSTATMMYGHVEQADDLLDHSTRSATFKTSTAASRPSSRGRSSRATPCSRSGSSTTRARTRICGCSPCRACISTTFPTSRRRGSPRASARARWRFTSAPTTGGGRSSRRTCTRPPIT